VDKLISNCRPEQRCVTTVAFAPLEEEAGAKLFPFIEQLGHSARNSRLSSARHTIQPENTLSLWVISPCSYLAEKFHSSLWVASWVMLIFVRVEPGAFRYRQDRKIYFLTCHTDEHLASVTSCAKSNARCLRAIALHTKAPWNFFARILLKFLQIPNRRLVRLAVPVVELDDL
jgi:hypothetical protein